MAIGPICGMAVAEASALHAERDGKTLYLVNRRVRLPKILIASFMMTVFAG
jgi:hypothetical protein